MKELKKGNSQTNKRSISGASNKNQFSFNAIKSQTPKNQNLSSGFRQISMTGNQGQRVSHNIKNMT